MVEAIALLITVALLVLIVDRIRTEELTYQCDHFGCTAELTVPAFRTSTGDRMAREAGWSYYHVPARAYCPEHHLESVG